MVSSDTVSSADVACSFMKGCSESLKRLLINFHAVLHMMLLVRSSLAFFSFFFSFVFIYFFVGVVVVVVFPCNLSLTLAFSFKDGFFLYLRLSSFNKM